MTYVADHILKDLHLPAAIAKETGSCPVTIIQRGTSRRILNLEEVVSTLKSDTLFSNVTVVRLENMTTLEQLRMARESCLLIGTFGAGLTWSAALDKMATLIELRWPQLPKNYFYSCGRGSITEKFEGTQAGVCEFGKWTGYVLQQSTRISVLFNQDLCVGTRSTSITRCQCRNLLIPKHCSRKSCPLSRRRSPS